MKKICPSLVILAALSLNSMLASELKISIGIRETGNVGALPIFGNGGSTGGIEFVNRDGQTLQLNNTWQLFTFTPSTDTLMAFAGATANSILDTEWVVLEQIRILNSGGNTAPLRLWIDNVSNTTTTYGTVTEGFETFALNDEVILQEASFSGSTTANLVPISSSRVSDSDAYAGTQSDELNFQFVDADPTRWARVTTFNAPNLANPLMLAQEPGAPAPTISFYMKGILVPEPSSLTIGLLGLCAWLGRRRKQA